MTNYEVLKELYEILGEPQEMSDSEINALLAVADLIGHGKERPSSDLKLYGPYGATTTEAITLANHEMKIVQLDQILDNNGNEVILPENYEGKTAKILLLGFTAAMSYQKAFSVCGAYGPVIQAGFTDMPRLIVRNDSGNSLTIPNAILYVEFWSSVELPKFVEPA